MSGPTTSELGKESVELVPRFKDQGYATDLVSRRRDWLEQKTRCCLDHVGNFSIPGEQMRGNIENPIGVAQVPVGVAGPLLINGAHAQGTFYVPMATTRKMANVTQLTQSSKNNPKESNAILSKRSVRVLPERAQRKIIPKTETVYELKDKYEIIRAEADSTTNHGKLLRIEPHPVGREVIVNFCYFTADAHGMNMIAKATERACEWIMQNSRARHFYALSGFCSEKRPSGFLLTGGKGKKVSAGALVPRDLVRTYLHTTPEKIFDMWHRTLVAQTQSNTIGYNGQYANGLAAIFIACGQDVANVVNSAVGITDFEVTAEGDLYASVTLPSLSVATVGGGTGLGTARECLQVLVRAGRHLGQSIVDLIGDPPPLLLLRHLQPTDQILESAFAHGDLLGGRFSG